MSDPYASWKQASGFDKAQAEAWKSDLKPGQIVVATQDLEDEGFDDDDNYIVFDRVSKGTRGVVVGHAETKQEWRIKWPGIEDEWHHVFNSAQIYWDEADREYALDWNEIAPAELWERWPDIETPEPPEVSPDQIPLFGSETTE